MLDDLVHDSGRRYTLQRREEYLMLQDVKQFYVLRFFLGCAEVRRCCIRCLSNLSLSSDLLNSPTQVAEYRRELISAGWNNARHVVHTVTVLLRCVLFNLSRVLRP